MIRILLGALALFAPMMLSSSVGPISSPRRFQRRNHRTAAAHKFFCIFHFVSTLISALAALENPSRSGIIAVKEPVLAEHFVSLGARHPSGSR